MPSSATPVFSADRRALLSGVGALLIAGSARGAAAQDPAAATRAVIAARPAGGWTAAADFWSQAALAGLEIGPTARDQVTVRTDYFDLRIDVDHGGTHAVRTALIEARPGIEARTVIRRWTPEE